MGRLAGVWIKSWKGKFVSHWVMHREKKLPGLNRIGDEHRGGHLGSPGRDQRLLIGSNAERFGIDGIHLHIDLVWIQFVQHGGFPSSSLRVPLRRGASTR